MEWQNFYTERPRTWASFVHFSELEKKVIDHMAKKEIKKRQKRIKKLIETHDDTVRHDRKIEDEQDIIDMLTELIEHKTPQER